MLEEKCRMLESENKSLSVKYQREGRRAIQLEQSMDSHTLYRQIELLNQILIDKDKQIL